MRGMKATMLVRLSTASSGGNRLVIDFDPAAYNTRETLPPGLVGSQFVVRRHSTIADVYPPSLFNGGRDPALVDQLQFFAGQGYETVFLLDIGDGTPAYWTSSANALLNDVSGRVLPPAGACFIKKTGASTDLLTFGQVRVNKFIQPLQAGLNMIGSPNPRDHSPSSRKLLLEDGFYGDTNPAIADQIQVWSGDWSGTETGFTSYFLIDGGLSSPYRYWTGMESAALTNEENRLFFLRDRGAFLKCADDHPGYFVPGLSYP